MKYVIKSLTSEEYWYSYKGESGFSDNIIEADEFESKLEAEDALSDVYEEHLDEDYFQIVEIYTR